MSDVDWKKKATTDLADICLQHMTMWHVIDAAEQDISRKLQRDPIQYSQEISEGLRRIISWPLVAYFSLDGNRVEVEAVGWIG
jgi:hypothetical protein